jgi:hypothetical protein
VWFLDAEVDLLVLNGLGHLRSTIVRRGSERVDLRLTIVALALACTPTGPDQDEPAPAVDAKVEPEPEDTTKSYYFGGRLAAVYDGPPVPRELPPPASACQFDEAYRISSRGRVLTFVPPPGWSGSWPEQSRVCVWSRRGELLASLLSADLEWVVCEDLYLLSEAGLIPGAEGYWDLDSDCVLRVRTLAGELQETYRFFDEDVQAGCNKHIEYGLATEVSFRRYARGRTIGIRSDDEWVFARPVTGASRD